MTFYAQCFFYAAVTPSHPSVFFSAYAAVQPPSVHAFRPPQSVHVCSTKKNFSAAIFHEEKFWRPIFSRWTFLSSLFSPCLLEKFPCLSLSLDFGLALL